MSKKWIVSLLVVVMLFSISGVIAADNGENEGWQPGDGGPFEAPPGQERKETVTEGVYNDEEESVNDAVYDRVIGRQGRPPAHVWERWDKWEVGPPGFVLDMMDAKFTEIENERININGNPFQSDVPPVIREGRALVSVRAMAEWLDADVEWNQDDYMVVIEKGDTTIILKLGDTVYVINDEEKEMDTFAAMHKDRTLVPIRFVAEALGHDVEYDEETGNINLSVEMDPDEDEENDEDENNEE